MNIGRAKIDKDFDMYNVFDDSVSNILGFVYRTLLRFESNMPLVILDSNIVAGRTDNSCVVRRAAIG